MPQCKPVKSLKAACLHNITKNMDNVWCKNYKDNFLGQGAFIYVDGPFEFLPGFLVCDLLRILKKERLLQRHHLHLLITSNIERLDLSKDTADMAPILNLISFRCKDSLKELSLARCSRIPRLVLKNMISVLGNLEVLDLSWINVHDDILETVGANCSKLRELDVSLSHYVSDRGINHLFNDEDWDHRFGKCKALTKLHIQDTRVSASGVEAALRQLPNLQHLNHPKVVTALDIMHRADWEAGVTIPPYRLKSLFADYRSGNNYPSSDLPDVSLSVATDVCPNATDAHLLAYRFRDNPDSILSLCKLKYLRVLNIIVDDGGEDDSKAHMDFFSHAVTPVLQSCGKSITYISLGEFPPGVDVGIIGMCCPFLQELNLAFNKGYKNSACKVSSSCDTHFSSLKRLNLVFICSNVVIFKDLSQPNPEANAPDLPSIDLPPVHMKSLLSSPALEAVFIRESSVLTDQLLREVLSKGQKFTHLREMELEQCHNITSQFVYSLLNLPGPLKSLKLWECRQLTRSDVNSFKSVCRKNRWDFHIDWT
ncbi:uncharacterized protein [Hetaerina americana]|uniref:uncharacterized protein n=1 Tax=Hetaerina americana TaxID=62018 RepID=UPI003A7F1F08